MDNDKKFKCGDCGASVSDSDRICPSCGAELEDEEEEEERERYKVKVKPKVEVKPKIEVTPPSCAGRLVTLIVYVTVGIIIGYIVTIYVPQVRFVDIETTKTVTNTITNTRTATTTVGGSTLTVTDTVTTTELGQETTITETVTTTEPGQETTVTNTVTTTSPSVTETVVQTPEFPDLMIYRIGIWDSTPPLMYEDEVVDLVVGVHNAGNLLSGGYTVTVTAWPETGGADVPIWENSYPSLAVGENNQIVQPISIPLEGWVRVNITVTTAVAEDPGHNQYWQDRIWLVNAIE
jgi:hypothetical protein